VFAFELTEAEYEALEPETKMGAYCEILKHGDNKVIARILCEQEEQAAKGEVILVVRHFA
jgi:ASC-1-like (ASCH) protein